jgi:hypothetical protein
MHEIQVHLNDQQYAQALRRAVEFGFKSVDEYAADILSADLDESSAYDKLFTPERLSHIDAVLAEVDSGGKTYTADEVKVHFRNRLEA